MKKKTCVRCGMVPRSDDPFHRGVGALSRVDNKTEICSDCGVAEAMDDFLGLNLIPKESWPIEKDADE